MKNFILLFLGYFFLVNHSDGQQSSLGITAGSAFASFKINNQSGSVTSQIKTGLMVGITTSIGLTPHCSLMSGLNYIQKGGALLVQGMQVTKINFDLNYLEIPVNMVYNSNLPEGNFFIGAGPSFSIGFSGKDMGGLQPIEVGVNFLTGYQFKNGTFIAANYNTGLNNLFKSDSQYKDDTQYHNIYFGIRFGYMLPTVKKHFR